MARQWPQTADKTLPNRANFPIRIASVQFGNNHCRFRHRLGAKHIFIRAVAARAAQLDTFQHAKALLALITFVNGQGKRNFLNV